MFKEPRERLVFDWRFIGDISVGRPNLGPLVPVAVYRLMQFTLRDVMVRELGPGRTDVIFFQAGEHAGREFYRNVLTDKGSFDALAGDIQSKFREMGIGIFRVEKADLGSMEFVFTVAEDLDCSGMPVCSEQVCTYDEGFIRGILTEFTGAELDVREVDCWCSGDRVCRFVAKSAKS